jgi:uncharacterized protein YifN (PemK superfamily)
MAITFHPKQGMVLFCNFSRGFKAPEMVKDNRPVVAISGPMNGRPNLVTVVPLSTVEPNPIMPYHLQIEARRLPPIGTFMNRTTWLKGDMIYTVGFHRLNAVQLPEKDRRTGKRKYYYDRFGRDYMRKIYACVLHGISLGKLSQHL